MAENKNKIRIVTATSLFDGHDASINIMRRLLQDFGAEVIHLGHNRSVEDIVTAAIQEGAQGIAVSSYQGGHLEFFKYMRDLLDNYGAPYVKIFGGGGGVIIHEEKRELEAYGISRVYHPDDGRRMGLEGMIQDIVQQCDFDVIQAARDGAKKKPGTGMDIPDDRRAERARDLELGLRLTALKPDVPERVSVGKEFRNTQRRKAAVVGLTGTGGAGKSSLCDELLQRFLNAFPKAQIAVLSVDPSKKKTGGALLGDRIRVNSLSRGRIFMRFVASRQSGHELAEELPQMIELCRDFSFDLIVVESSGIGQSSSKITDVSDVSVYVMTSEFGAQSQLEKIDMIDFADLIAINKGDRRGSQDALRDVRKQYRRSRKLFHEPKDELLPVFVTRASQFNDGGVHSLFASLVRKLAEKDTTATVPWTLTSDYLSNLKTAQAQTVIPPERQNYLALIAAAVRNFKKKTEDSANLAGQWQAVVEAQKVVGESADLKKAQQDLEMKLGPAAADLKGWDSLVQAYSGDVLHYKIRGQEIVQPLVSESLSGLKIRRVLVPRLSSWADRMRYLKLENVPGVFPYTAGVFPLKRAEEEPRRQFAGEGTPEKTNKRFHYLSANDKAKRLSTAFDSVTLYGEDPDLRPDIYGKVGESGVSICTLEDMKKLYAGFDLCDPFTSVSMTINGPAPMILAFFLNTAIDRRIEDKEKSVGRVLNPQEYLEAKAETLKSVRGTVQADILKEDQAQNTCIFSTDFALKMMGDIQDYFIRNSVRNFYSVSISGYHIAEAGANPISQLAFTLANGFTYVEYYLSRGMKIDDFAPNLSFFFSNGLDPEYSVLGRVARRIWAVAMRDLYSGNDRSQKLKYHIQTSGRSLHAQEIDFNDIRTTLQALIAIYDNCNSLHTNAYDEAITTPTEQSVRRAMAIQMIVNREFGMTKNENATQGSYFMEELTDLVEEAVLEEFMRLSERGGVLGSMETQYQRSKIQEESLKYEHLKHTGAFPVIGVNTFIDPKTLDPSFVPPRIEMARASKEEKGQQLKNLQSWQKKNSAESSKQLDHLRKVALSGGNVFEALMGASRSCSLGQMSRALYEVGGQYRRSL